MSPRSLAVQITSDAVADVLAGSSKRPEVAALLRDAVSLGLAFEPMHAGTRDPELRTWFLARARTNAEVSDLSARLMAHPVVLAAYAKPEDELP